jgi:hypothetical protein
MYNIHQYCCYPRGNKICVSYFGPVNQVQQNNVLWWWGNQAQPSNIEDGTALLARGDPAPPLTSTRGDHSRIPPGYLSYSCDVKTRLGEASAFASSK